MAKLSQRKRATGVSPPDSSAAPSAANAGIAARKNVRSAVARSGTARRQTFITLVIEALTGAFIGPPGVVLRLNRKVVRQEWFRQFRRPAHYSILRVANARLPLPRQGLLSRPAIPVAPRNAPRSPMPAVLPRRGVGLPPARQKCHHALCAALRYMRAASLARQRDSLPLPDARPLHACGVRTERARAAQKNSSAKKDKKGKRE